MRHDPYNDCQIKEGVNGFVYHDSAEFGSLIRAHFEKSPEDIKAFSEGVVQSVAGYGVRELAEKVLEVYRYAQRRHKLTQSSKRKAFLVTPVAVHIGKRKNDASDKNEAER